MGERIPVLKLSGEPVEITGQQTTRSHRRLVRLGK